MVNPGRPHFIRLAGRSNKERVIAMDEILDRATGAQTLSQCRWKPDGVGWRLMLGKRCFGRVVPDQKHPAMWRSLMPGGRQLSDMANLSWARHAVLEVARRELAYEARQHPPNWPENDGVFRGASSVVRFSDPAFPEVWRGAAE